MRAIIVTTLTRLLSPIFLALVLAGCASEHTAQSTLDKWYPQKDYFEQLETEALEAQAKQGSLDAKLDLAIRLMNGDRTARNEIQGFALLEEVAMTGDARGEFFLGTAHMNGAGTPVNPAKAIELFKRSAEKGYDLGQYWYAYMLSRGLGRGEVNWFEALPWFLKAAHQGHPDAQFTVGEIYDSCRGVDRDFEEAAKWYRKAFLENGSILASHNLRRLIDLGLVQWADGDPGVAPTKFIVIEDSFFEKCAIGLRDPLFDWMEPES